MLTLAASGLIRPDKKVMQYDDLRDSVSRCTDGGLAFYVSVIEDFHSDAYNWRRFDAVVSEDSTPSAELDLQN